MTRRTLHIPLLIVSLVLAAATGVGVVLGHGWQLSRTAQALLVHADVQEKKGDWSKAGEFLDRFLRLQPADKAARVRLAEVYGKGAKSLEEKQIAVSLHYRALGAGVAEKEAALRLRLAELLLDTGRLQEADKEVRRVLATDADNASGQRILALAMAGQMERGALGGANLKELGLIAALERAKKANPSDVQLALITARAYREWPQLVQAEQPDLTAPERAKRADECMDELVSGNQKTAEAYVARFVYRKNYQLQGADADLEKALQLGPNNPEVLLTAAGARLEEALQIRRSETTDEIAKELFGNAKGYYETLTKLPEGEDPRVYAGLGESYLGMKDVDAAVATWRKGIKQFTKPTIQAGFYSRIAESLLNQDRMSEAKEAITALDKLLEGLGTSVPSAEKLSLRRSQDLRTGYWHLKKGDAAAAIPCLRRVVSGQSQGADSEIAGRAWALLGAAYAGVNEWNDSARAFDRAAKLQPNTSSHHLAAANSWLLAGRPDLATEQAEEATALQPTIQGWLILASAQLQLQAAAPPAEKNWTRFETAMSVLERAPQNELDAPWRIDFLRADHLRLQVNNANSSTETPDEYIDALRKTETKYAGSADYWSQLCLAYQQLGQTADADRALEQLRKLEGTSARSIIVAARLASAREKFDDAAKMLTDANASLSPSDRVKLQSEIINVAIAQQDLPLARKLLIQQLGDGKDISLIRRLAEIDLQLRDLAGLAKWEALLGSSGPQGEPWELYFRACRLFLSAKSERDVVLNEASAAQASLAVLRPNWAESLTLKGMIEQRLGRFEQAAQCFEQAIQLGERRITVYEQLIALLDRLNRTADVQKYLSRLSEQRPMSQRLTEMASYQEVRQDNRDAALRIAKQGIEKRPDDPLARLWLGRLLLVMEKPVEAEKEFEQAVRLAPADVRSWNGLFSFHARTGNKEKAKETLKRLTENVKLEPAEQSFVMAQGLELIGEVESALASYKEAARQSPNSVAIQLRLASIYARTDPAEAEKCLTKALQLDPNAAAARRMLAALLAAKGGEQDLAKAEALLGHLGQDGAIAVEDRRLRAMLLAQRGGNSNIKRAIGLLEDIVSQETSNVPGDRLLLAQLYELQARIGTDQTAIAASLEAARAKLMSLAAKADPQLSHLASLINFLLRHKQQQEVEAWLTKYEALLTKRPKDNPDEIAQLLQLRFAHGTAEKAATWLDRLEKVDKDPMRALTMRARLLSGDDVTGQAERLVEPVAKKLATDVITPAAKGTLCRQVGDLYFSINHFAAAERWYRILLADHPSELQRLAMAVARQGRLEEAIGICVSSSLITESALPATVLAAVLLDRTPSSDILRKTDATFQNAASRFPNDAELLFAIGLVRVMELRHGDAISLFRKVVATNPRHVGAINNLALLLAETPGSRQEALALIDKAIDIAGMDGGLLDTKGTILIYDGQSEKAITFLEPAAKGLSLDPRHNFHLAVAYKDMGDIEKAKTELQLALDQKLEEQILTSTDRKLLEGLKAMLGP